MRKKGHSRRSSSSRSRNNGNWRRQQEIHEKEQKMWASVYREPLKGIPKIKKWKGNQLSNNILNDLVGNVEPTAEIVNKRRRVLNTISEIVTKLIPGSEVGIFGSVASGMDTSTSDVDVIIFFRNTVVPIDVHAVLRGVKIKLKEESDSGADDIKGSYLFLESSRVPVVKIVTDLGVSVDISCQNTWTLVGNRIVSNYLAEFPMLAPLTRLVKLWLKRRSIRPSRYGGLSSWGWSYVFFEIDVVRLIVYSSAHSLHTHTRTDFS